jgi:hypothetical protein
LFPCLNSAGRRPMGLGISALARAGACTYAERLQGVKI